MLPPRSHPPLNPATAMPQHGNDALFVCTCRGVRVGAALHQGTRTHIAPRNVEAPHHPQQGKQQINLQYVFPDSASSVPSCVSIRTFVHGGWVHAEGPRKSATCTGVGEACGLQEAPATCTGRYAASVELNVKGLLPECSFDVEQCQWKCEAHLWSHSRKALL